MTKQHSPFATLRADKTVAALEANPEYQVEIDVDLKGNEHALTEEARRTVALDLAHLNPIQLGRQFPRDPNGRLKLKTQVALEQLECEKKLPQFRSLWLTALGPQRRSDGQVFQVRLEPLIAENQNHRWDLQPWKWDDRAMASTPADDRVGISKKALEELRENPSKLISRLEKKARDDSLTDTQRCQLSILWQDAGRFVEALQLYKTTVSPDALEILNGVESSLETDKSKWQSSFQSILWESGPWKFADAIHQEADRLKRYRRRGEDAPAGLRLLQLPGQYMSRKMCIFLTEQDGLPTIVTGYTGSNARLPEALWRRCPSVDLFRFAGYRKSDPIDDGAIPFLTEINAASDNATPYSVYADWLEERGDRRCDWIRAAHAQ